MPEQVSITISPILECNECDEVLLELHNPILLAANIGLPDPNDGSPFIRAKIIDITEISQHLANYVFEYDETLLTNPGTPLEPEDIKQVCCVGCTLKYLDTFAICEIIQNSDPDCLNGVTFFNVQADSGPVQTIEGGDLVSLVGGVSISTVASDPDTFTFNLDLSGDAGNILTFGGDGNLFLDCPTVLACINVENPIHGDGSAGDPFGIDISADAGNIIEIRPDGLFAEEFDTNLTCAQVLACINVDNPIVGDGELSTPFTVAISADANNLIELRPDGLYATDNCASVLACINVANPISGDGSVGDPFTVDLSADVGNVLELRVDGLYSAGAPQTITTFAPAGIIGSARAYRYTSEDATITDIPAGITTIDSTGGGACEGIGANFMLKHASISAGATVNTLNLRGAPEVAHDASFVGFTDNVPVPLDALGLYINPIFGPFVFNNPFTCRRAAIIVGTQYQAAWQRNSGNPLMDFVFEHFKSINGGPFTSVSQTRRAFSANGVWASSLESRERGMDTVNGPLAIGGSINLRLQSTVNVTAAGPAGSALGPQNGGVSVEFFSTN